MPAAIKELVNLPAGSAFRVLTWQGNLREVYWAMSDDRRQRIDGEGDHWHYHQALELTHFSRGSGTRFVGDRIQSFEPGEVVLLGENLPHYWHAIGSSAGISVQFFFPPSNPLWVLPESLKLAALFDSARRGLHFSGASAERIIGLMQELVGGDGLERFGLLLQILAVAARAPREELEYISTRAFSVCSDSSHQNEMRAAVRFLLTHYQEELRLAQLLEVTRMSKPTFSRYFKQHSGMPLGKFLQQIRLEAACRELAQTEKPVIEIALACGFSQISFFNRAFQRALRCTPSWYRECHRQGQHHRPAPIRLQQESAVQPAAATGGNTLIDELELPAAITS